MHFTYKIRISTAENTWFAAADILPVIRPYDAAGL